MSPTHHPDEGLLLDFATGAIDMRTREVVQVHLHTCRQCTEDVELFEAAGGAAMLAFSPELPATPQAMARAVDSLVGVHIDTRELEVFSAPPTRQALDVDASTRGWSAFVAGAQLLPIAWPERTRALLVVAANPGLPLTDRLRPKRPLAMLRGQLRGADGVTYERGDLVPAEGDVVVSSHEPAIFVLGVARTKS